MYAGVPTTAPVLVSSDSASTGRAGPKSNTLIAPFGASSHRFAGLMSRWTRPSLCAAASPVAASAAIRMIWGIGGRPFFFR